MIRQCASCVLVIGQVSELFALAGHMFHDLVTIQIPGLTQNEPIAPSSVRLKT
jgi:hypothetical protein